MRGVTGCICLAARWPGDRRPSARAPRFGVSPADYDGWAEAGNQEWPPGDALPAFRAVERDLGFGRRPWHAGSGPLLVRRWSASRPGWHRRVRAGTWT
jgi:hypothetical protein